MEELRALLVEVGFDRVEIVPKERSREVIGQWTDDTTDGEFVVSATITAYKPGGR